MELISLRTTHFSSDCIDNMMVSQDPASFNFSATWKIHIGVPAKTRAVRDKESIAIFAFAMMQFESIWRVWIHKKNRVHQVTRCVRTAETMWELPPLTKVPSATRPMRLRVGAIFFAVQVTSPALPTKLDAEEQLRFLLEAASKCEGGYFCRIYCCIPMLF